MFSQCEQTATIDSTIISDKINLWKPTYEWLNNVGSVTLQCKACGQTCAKCGKNNYNLHIFHEANDISEY